MKRTKAPPLAMVVPSDPPSMLKSTGLISYTRGNIHINDRKGLEKSACECYEVSRLLLNEYLGGNNGNQ